MHSTHSAHKLGWVSGSINPTVALWRFNPDLDRDGHAMDPSHPIHQFAKVLLRNVFTIKRKEGENLEHSL